MLCCSLGNENSDAGHIKCARGPHVPYPWCRATVYASCFLFSFWVRVGLRCAMVSCAFEVATWLKACFGFQPFADNRWLIVQPSFSNFCLWHCCRQCSLLFLVRRLAFSRIPSGNTSPALDRWRTWRATTGDASTWSPPTAPPTQPHANTCTKSQRHSRILARKNFNVIRGVIVVVEANLDRIATFATSLCLNGLSLVSAFLSISKSLSVVSDKT